MLESVYFIGGAQKHACSFLLILFFFSHVRQDGSCVSVVFRLSSSDGAWGTELVVQAEVGGSLIFLLP